MNIIDEIQWRFENMIHLQDLDHQVYDIFEEIYIRVHINSYDLVVSQLMEDAK